MADPKVLLLANGHSSDGCIQPRMNGICLSFQNIHVLFSIFALLYYKNPRPFHYASVKYLENNSIRRSEYCTDYKYLWTNR
jgi:hypothetical protein